MDGQRPPTFLPSGTAGSGGGGAGGGAGLPPPRFFNPAAAGGHGEAQQPPSRGGSGLPSPLSPFQSKERSGTLPPPPSGAFGAAHTNPLYATAPAGGVPSPPAVTPAAGGMPAPPSKRFDLENAGPLPGAPAGWSWAAAGGGPAMPPCALPCMAVGGRLAPH